MNKHNHTGLDESVSVASNTMQAVNTGKAISAAAKGAAAGGPYGAVIGAALSAREQIWKIAAAALVLLALPLLFILLLPGIIFGIRFSEKALRMCRSASPTISPEQAGITMK